MFFIRSPMFFIRSWTPASWTKLVKNSPPNMMRPKRHCRTRQGKIIIFDYLELLYKGVYIHTAQRCSLNPLNTFPTPKVKFTWLQRPWWRAIFRNTAILDIIPVIYYKLVSQATVFVTSHNTTPHEREGKGEEGGALCDETKTGRWETTYKLDLGNITLDPGKATTTQLHGLSGRQSKLWILSLFHHFFAMWPKFKSCLHLQKNSSYYWF